MKGVAENRIPKIGEVYLADLRGQHSVQSGLRPVVVFQNNIGNAFSPNVGVFYRKYMLERAGVEVDFKDVAADFIRDKEYSLHGHPIDRRRKLLAVSNDYRKDYERWKAAHYIF